jgi:hypothetical protein
MIQTSSSVSSVVGYSRPKTIGKTSTTPATKGFLPKN